MAIKFKYYCTRFMVTPAEMLKILAQYYGTPKKVVTHDIEQYYSLTAEQHDEFFKPRAKDDMSIRIDLDKGLFIKMITMHESGKMKKIMRAAAEW